MLIHSQSVWAQAGNGALMARSFSASKPYVRTYFNTQYFYCESDGMPNPSIMPNLMVGITAWQQQVPIPLQYFINLTNPEGNSGSLGYGQPNIWRLPLIPVPSSSPLPLTSGNFQRGAVAIAANGIPIFNPRNNTGQFSYAIGELDAYGGHCGRADDYHYHIAPVHLQSVVGDGLPIAWSLDGYPIYGYTEPDGSARLALDADGGHSHGVWGYHYHAIGTAATGPASPYLMNAFHGTVVNFGGQVDPQPTAQTVSPAGAPLAGASIVGFARPATDQYSLTYRLNSVNYTVGYTVDRVAKSVSVQWGSPSGTTSNTYTNTNRWGRYPMAAWSMFALPDTGQTSSYTSTFGEDSDYSIRPPSYTNNGDGTTKDNVTGLIWQRTDGGEMTWDNARTYADNLVLGGQSDWRLPTAQELLSIVSLQTNPALDSTYFVSNSSGTPAYFWSSDFYAGDSSKVWCTNAGGGLGPKPKTETISAGGTSRFHARCVRGAAPSDGHQYVNNLDGTVTDTDTGLTWQAAPASAMNWNAALTYADSLNLAGYSDWRLPNMKELQSLVTLPQTKALTSATALACVNRILFPTMTAAAHWTSSTLRSANPTSAWLVEFGVNSTVPAANGPPRSYQGIVSYEIYSATYPVICVRGGGISGDINLDGLVNGADLGLMLSEWGSCSSCLGDLNKNGQVDGEDLGILLSAWQ